MNNTHYFVNRSNVDILVQLYLGDVLDIEFVVQKDGGGEERRRINEKNTMNKKFNIDHRYEIFKYDSNTKMY